jgi:two-component system, NtrC family, sensor kinase
MRVPSLPGTRSIRGKMILASHLPLVLTLLVVWGAALYLIDGWIVGEAQHKVRHDLGVARSVLTHEEERIRDVIRFSTGYVALALILEQNASGTVAQEMGEILRRERLDFLTLTDSSGRIVLQGGSIPSDGGGYAPGALVGETTPDGYCGPIVLSELELKEEGAQLATKARIARRASPFDVESRGMLLVCSSPVADEEGEVRGHLYGGVLLNGNLELIDRIKKTVYGGENFRGTKVGSATLFLDDLRVATTVLLREGERALGTTMSAEVAEAVLGERRLWLARAKVVDEWYLTAYEPILGPDGAAIGAFYVGQLESPFTLLKRQAAFALLFLLIFGGALGVIIARQGASRIARPILDLEAGARRIAAGERDLRVSVEGDDEIGALGSAFNAMTASLREQEEALQKLNRELEEKVQARTAELEEKSRQLIRAREELARTEKLAAIGSLAAGVAHEINNPAAIIRGNAEIILSLPSCSEGHREEAQVILRQTERISSITQNLLTFARHKAAVGDRIDVSELMADVLVRIPHQAPLGKVEVRKELASPLPAIEADAEQLRQVFNNLLLNALQVMEGQGRLTVKTRRDGGFVLIEVADSGPGIPPENLKKIFDPFFTTRRGGTGLGLSVSYGIVQALGGAIDVESEPGKGALFRVRLKGQ